HRPPREGQLAWIFPLALAVLVEQALSRQLPRLPGLAGGNTRRIEAIQVTSGRQAVGVLDRVATIGTGDMPALQGLEVAMQLLVVVQLLPIPAALLEPPRNRRVTRLCL